MNPSSSGWIQKFINDYGWDTLSEPFLSEADFYRSLRATGFIYGVSVRSMGTHKVSRLKLSLEEQTKVNLLHALLHQYCREVPNSEAAAAIESIIGYYRSIERGKQSFFKRLKPVSRPSELLERILSARIQESNSFLKRDVTSLLTFALLFVDVLGFRQYLKVQTQLKDYLDQLERSLIHFSMDALRAKKEKNKYDHMLIEMVMESGEFVGTDTPLAQLFGAAQDFDSNLEKQYVLDLCSLAVWDDRQLDSTEEAYLLELTKALNGSESDLEHSWGQLMAFSKAHAKKIKLFEYSHPVRQFYNQATDTVGRLILRNRDRLLRELNESGELIQLLGQSTVRDLTRAEKRKVREQLMDIFKTIPSLTIFMLPGGTILLPLFIKLVPKLLPSAFHENRIEKK